MIKFFRKIRQRLLTENKFSKYLLYAIGEVFLVVIGIMIALQANNWNQERKQFNNELQISVNLLDDLINEYENIEFHQDRFIKYQNFNFQLYDESIGKSQYDENVYYNYLQWVHRYNVFIGDKYDKFLSSITNKKIHSKLKLYIDQELYTKGAIEEWNDQQRQRVRPFLSKHGINNSEVSFQNHYYDFTPLTRINFINHSKLFEQYGTIEFDQLLFDRRFKTAFVYQNLVWQLVINRELQVILSHELSSTKLKDSYEQVKPKTIEELILLDKTTDEIIEIITNEVNKKPIHTFSEEEINDFGYELMRVEKFQDALSVFKLNTELFPDQWNTHDSYGECLLELGDIENGIKAYEKSLELNPGNASAIEALKNIKNEG